MLRSAWATTEARRAAAARRAACPARRAPAASGATGLARGALAPALNVHPTVLPISAPAGRCCRQLCAALVPAMVLG